MLVDSGWSVMDAHRWCFDLVLFQAVETKVMVDR